MALKHFEASRGNVDFLKTAHSKAMTALVQGHTLDVNLSAGIIAIAAGYVWISKVGESASAVPTPRTYVRCFEHVFLLFPFIHRWVW